MATKKYAKENRFRSWWVTFSTFALVIGAFFTALYPFPILVRILASLTAGMALVRLFIIYHDYLHHTILKNSWLAKGLFTFVGLYMLNPPSIWKRSHDYHHKHNSKLLSSSIGSFPIVTIKKFKSFSRSERNIYLTIRHPLTIAAGYLSAFVWGMCILSLYRNPKKHWDSAISLVLHYAIGITILLTLGWTTFFLGFLIPALISSGLGSYLFYAQHNFPTATFADNEGWTYIGAALKSSSHMKMNPVMRWFTGNIGFHHIHHTNAKIPFYRLREVYKAIPEFHTTKTTSLLPWDIVKCLRMKVWDPKLNRMLTMREIKNYPKLAS